ISDVPLGAFLSGGVDSTIIVGLMAGLRSGESIKTFSIGFEGDPRFDETRYARVAATRYRTDHTPFTVTPQSFELLERLVRLYDQPFGDSSAIPTYILSQLTRRQVTVALSGDGGDELFAGYVRFLAALAADRVPQPVLALADRLCQTLSADRRRSWIGAAKRFTAIARYPLPERYLRWMAFCRQPEDWLRANGPLYRGSLGAHPAMRTLWGQSAGWPVLARLLHLNFTDYLPNDLLVKADRCSMAHGLEVRSPFLDTALIEYVAGLPDGMKAAGWQTKRILRRACADLLPPEIQRRRKMGFGVPLGTWFRGRWREPLREYLESPGSRVARYLHPERLCGLIDAHLAGRVDASHELWLFLTLEVWLRQLERPRPCEFEPALVVQHSGAPAAR
ncbi:MAG: asparagine synthetase B family protein, partial [bacterium]